MFAGSIEEMASLLTGPLCLNLTIMDAMMVITTMAMAEVQFVKLKLAGHAQKVTKQQLRYEQRPVVMA